MSQGYFKYENIKASSVYCFSEQNHHMIIIFIPFDKTESYLTFLTDKQLSKCVLSIVYKDYFV